MGSCRMYAKFRRKTNIFLQGCVWNKFLKFGVHHAKSHLISWFILGLHVTCIFRNFAYILQSPKILRHERNCVGAHSGGRRATAAQVKPWKMHGLCPSAGFSPRLHGYRIMWPAQIGGTSQCSHGSRVGATPKKVIYDRCRSTIHPRPRVNEVLTRHMRILAACEPICYHSLRDIYWHQRCRHVIVFCVYGCTR